MRTVSDFEAALRRAEQDGAGLADLERALAGRARFMPARTVESLSTRMRQLQCTTAVPAVSVPRTARLPMQAAHVDLGAAPPVSGRPGGSLVIRNVRNVARVFPAHTGSVLVEDVDESTVSLGPTGGAVYLRRVTNSTICVSSHQLRLVDCHRLQMRVGRLDTAPITEHCTQIEWGPSPDADGGSEIAQPPIPAVDFTGGQI